METKHFKLEKLKWNGIQVIIDYEMGEFEIDPVVGYFNISELENEYFRELLLYFLTYGNNEYKDWFEEFIFIPKEENGEPMKIADVSILKFENGEVTSLDFCEEK